MTGATSEPGCTLHLGEWSAPVEGTAFEVSVPFEVLQRHKELTVRDAAGNEVAAPLPYDLVTSEFELLHALTEHGLTRPLFLLPGDYRLGDDAVTGRAALGSRPG